VRAKNQTALTVLRLQVGVVKTEPPKLGDKPMADWPTYSFVPAVISNAPNFRGVYVLLQDGVVIYIGRAAGDSVSIRSRLLSHFRGDEGPCTARATEYRFEITDAPVTREKELLDEFWWQHGRLPRCNERRG